MFPDFHDGPARAAPDGRGVTVQLRVQPGARRNAVTGTVTEADGTVRLRVTLTAPPEGGKANAALITLLAKRWRVVKSAVTLRTGTTGRRKTILVAGDPATILARIRNDLGNKGE